MKLTASQISAEAKRFEAMAMRGSYSEGTGEWHNHIADENLCNVSVGILPNPGSFIHLVPNGTKDEVRVAFVRPNSDQCIVTVTYDLGKGGDFVQRSIGQGCGYQDDTRDVVTVRNQEVSHLVDPEHPLTDEQTAVLNEWHIALER